MPKIVPNPVKTKNMPKKNQNLFKIRLQLASHRIYCSILNFSSMQSSFLMSLILFLIVTSVTPAAIPITRCVCLRFFDWQTWYSAAAANAMGSFPAFESFNFSKSLIALFWMATERGGSTFDAIRETYDMGDTTFVLMSQTRTISL